VVAFTGDATGNGRNNFADPTAIARLATSLDTVLPAYPTIDFGIVADASQNGATNLFDATLVAQFAASIVVPLIPPIPPGVVITASGGGGGTATRLGSTPRVVNVPALLLPDTGIIEIDARATFAARTFALSTGGQIAAIYYPAVDTLMMDLAGPALDDANDEEKMPWALEEAVEGLLSAFDEVLME